MELQVKQEETRLESSSYVDPIGHVNSVAVSTDFCNNPVSTSMSVSNDSPLAVPFNVANYISLVPPFREKVVEAYFQAFEHSYGFKMCKLTGKA